MTGRPTKLNKVLQNRIVAALKTGATIEDACQHVGIVKSTFYDWLHRGNADEPDFSDFSNAVTRAQADAKMAAMKVLRMAMAPYEEVSTTIEEFTETRLTRSGTPYDYTRKTEKKVVTRYAGDWRAGVEYLKRRHYGEWGDRSKIDDWRSEAIELIRRGEVAYDALEQELGGELAEELFKSAGVPIANAGESSAG